ncbi:MAG: N-acetylmuramoyl-L-alanine amidase [Candidatus Chromulinivorax sp.]
MQIINFFLIILLAFSSTFLSATDPFTIMLDPAGDAKHTGRLIQDTFERGISLQCAEQLKTQLIQIFKNIRVILTRVPGETIQPLQNASFANRLNINLYISLYFYDEPELPTHVTLYHYIENSVTDFWHKAEPLRLYNINQAYLINIKTTQNWGTLFLETFSDKKYTKFFKPRGLFAIPFTPLIGIKAPALAIEVGLKNKEDWQHIIEPIITACQRIIQ